VQSGWAKNMNIGMVDLSRFQGRSFAISKTLVDSFEAILVGKVEGLLAGGEKFLAGVEVIVRWYEIWSGQKVSVSR
jgi:hypothetical protein